MHRGSPQSFSHFLLPSEYWITPLPFSFRAECFRTIQSLQSSGLFSCGCQHIKKADPLEKCERIQYRVANNTCLGEYNSLPLRTPALNLNSNCIQPFCASLYCTSILSLLSTSAWGFSEGNLQQNWAVYCTSQESGGPDVWLVLPLRKIFAFCFLFMHLAPTTLSHRPDVVCLLPPSSL